MVPIGRLATAIAAAATSWFITPRDLVAAAPAVAPNVTYIASGMFANPVISGDDIFELAGEPFSISVMANAATVPTTHGQKWAKYTMLKMTGTISTGLESTPFNTHSGLASIELATGNPSYDVFELFVPVSVIGMQINVLADIQMPPGTIATALIHPFASIALGAPDSVTYTDPASGTSTTLGLASGTLTATIPSGGLQDITEAPAGLQLHAGGAQAITTHADGSRSMRSVGRTPVDLGASSDVLVLQFYASGVSGVAEVWARIAGEDVPVLYAGPAGYFPGLEQVSVRVPRSLAGSGAVDMALTVGSRTSNPVRLQIQ